jgi:hypothetical protein
VVFGPPGHECHRAGALEAESTFAAPEMGSQERDAVIVTARIA